MTPARTRQDAADARAFAAYAATQDAVQLAAAQWATRRHAGLDAAGQAELSRWLAADPRHGAALAALERSFARVAALPDAAVQSLRAGLRPPAVPARRRWLRGLAFGVPQAALATTALALVGGGWLGWSHWRAQPRFAQQFATARGQRQRVDLPDGSRLELDAATRLAVRLFDDRREVQLLEGQAMFAVSHRPREPFEVLAGALRVTVLGTRFAVRHVQAGLDAGQTVVSVESGRVRVAGGSLVELQGGMAVAARGDGAFAPVTRVAPEAVAGWRQGRVSFKDTPLAEVLAEFARYGDTGLVAPDPAVGALRLGGSFDLAQAGAFAEALPHLLPVRLLRRGGHTEIQAR